MLALAALLGESAGCVERRMTIRSNPDGAMVYIDDYPIGTTPVSVSYIYYGTRKIRLIKDGYETMTVYQPMPTPWYEWFGVDFFSENVWPGKIRDERSFNYQLSPIVMVPNDQLVARAEQLRAANRSAVAAEAPVMAAPPVGVPPATSTLPPPTLPPAVLPPPTTGATVSPGVAAPPTFPCADSRSGTELQSAGWNYVWNAGASRGAACVCTIGSGSDKSGRVSELSAAGRNSGDRAGWISRVFCAGGSAGFAARLATDGSSAEHCGAALGMSDSRMMRRRR